MAAGNKPEQTRSREVDKSRRRGEEEEKERRRKEVF